MAMTRARCRATSSSRSYRIAGALAAPVVAVAAPLAALTATVAPTAGASGTHARPAVTAAACLAGQGGLSWSGSYGGGSRVGSVLEVSATVTCAGPNGPVAGLPLTISAVPAGHFKVQGPATVATSATGSAAFHLVGAAPGATTVAVTVASAACATSFGASDCNLSFKTTVQAAAGLPPAHPGRTFGIVPPRDPARNSANPPYQPAACHPPAGGPTKGYDPSLACAQAFLHYTNLALATEGAHPVALPSNWAHLTVAEQLFVTADLERVARGLPPYVGLSTSLDALAQAGAAANNDPNPPQSGYLGASSNWAGGSIAATDADYEWVYLDGWGGSKANTNNLDCTSPRASGCWGHRNDLLGQYTGVECTDCVMGAGATFTGNEAPSLTELFIEPQHAGEYPLYFTWVKNVLPYLPHPAG